MKRPKMILFDYGQTIGAEQFDGVKGTAAVLSYAVENRYGLTAEQVQEEAEKINKELNRFDPAARHMVEVEIPNHMFTGYLYEALVIKIDLSSEDIDRVFWDAAAPATVTEGLPEFLHFLWEQGIRTGVLSNICYAGEVVSERINRLLPDNHFEFIIATSEYLFRKPNTRIFKFALERAGLPAEDVWYVGDNYNCDVVGSRNAGLTPIWYKGSMDLEQDDKDAVIKIMKWTELEKLIGGI